MPHKNPIKVKSSNIDAVSYDEKTKTLRVHYLAGTSYEYHNITPDEHKALMAAKSLGSHMHEHIRGKSNKKL